MLRIYKVIVSVMSASFLIPLSLTAQQTINEDRIVRQTYARVTMASQVAVTEQAAQDTPAQYEANIANKTIKYEILAISVGDITPLLITPASKLTTFGDGMVINVGASTTSHKEMKTATMPETMTYEDVAFPRWVRGHEAVLTTWESFPLDKLLPYTEAPKATRYAEVSVNVTFEGKSRAYNSLFLFEPQGKIAILDNIANPSAFISKATYPHILLETRMRNQPNVAAWIASNQVAGCTANEKSECCDLSVMKCGVTPEDAHSSAVKNSFIASPISELAPGVKPDYAAGGSPAICSSLNFAFPYGGPSNVTDATGHYNGNHGYAATTYGTCTYSNPVQGQNATICNTSAMASVVPTIGDYGAILYPGFLHETGSAASYGYGNAQGAATASANGGGAVQSCLFGACSVTVTVSPLSFPANTVWTQSTPYNIACPAQTTPYAPSNSGGGGGGGIGYDPICDPNSGIYDPSQCNGDKGLVTKKD